MNAAIPGQRGLTLVEVLVALALMALLSVISWRALDMTDRSVQALQIRIQDTQSLVRVLGQLEHDLKRHVGWASNSNADSANMPASGSGVHYGQNILPGVLWRASVLSIVRTRENGAWQLVEWRQDGSRLLRAVSDPSYTLPMPELNAHEIVLEDIESFTLRQWDSDGQWVSPTESSGSRATVSGLKGIEVGVVRIENGEPAVFRKVVLLP
ncbi:MAG: prepilin-type N-terminal cleavage/methylation domain-containing protein [Pusillimonas sp.]|nr:prepilin-type N-terminal cleavage/methylation domain-containing protein [Pusillimonas sp.]